MKVELDWKEGQVSELQAPDGRMLIAVITPQLVRMIHREEDQLVIFSRPTESLEEGKRQGLDYAKAWLADIVGTETVYGESGG